MDTLPTVLLCVGIIVILLLLLAVYSGLLHNIEINVVDSPYPAFLVAYKFYTGPFKDCGPAFEAISKLAPTNKCMGIYYDDPDTTPSKDLRWAVCSVLAEDREEPKSEMSKLFTDNGYKLKALPKVNKVVKSWHPLRTRLSMYIAIWRVWNKLSLYIKKNDCDAHPWLELYVDNEMHFIGVLDQHDAFYVEETKGRK